MKIAIYLTTAGAENFVKTGAINSWEISHQVLEGAHYASETPPPEPVLAVVDVSLPDPETARQRAVEQLAKEITEKQAQLQAEITALRGRMQNLLALPGVEA